jgi:hypothetical protein
MLSNPLNRVIFRNEALDYFRFAIGPQNIDRPARTGIFPRHESWSLLGHPANMSRWQNGSSQLCCHNQTDPRPELERRFAGPERVAGESGLRGVHVRPVGASA